MKKRISLTYILSDYMRVVEPSAFDVCLLRRDENTHRATDNLKAIYIYSTHVEQLLGVYINIKFNKWKRLIWCVRVSTHLLVRLLRCVQI